MRWGFSLVGVIGLLVTLAGCPLEFQSEERANVSPNTYFERAPGDTTFQNQVQFSWQGTDLDSDVVAYQYRLIETDSVYYWSEHLPPDASPDQGRVLRSLDPRAERRPGGDPDVRDPFLLAADTEPGRAWSPRIPAGGRGGFQSFTELEDGWYEFWARAIDAQGAIDEEPARRRFYVFFDDKAPSVFIVNTPRCGRLPQGQTFYTFQIDAADSSRSSVTPREQLEYSVQLRAKPGFNCTQHIADPFTDWRKFPGDGLPVSIGATPPTLYVDLFPPGCQWSFTVRVRDPARNIGSDFCDLESP